MEKSELRKLLVAVALVFASLVTFGGIQQKIYFDLASSHAIASKQNALAEIRASCAVQPSPDRCRTGALRAARTEQREEYDLYSQRTMALWTAIMGIMAITGAALSAIGIYLVWRTWDATREAAESSRKTLRSYIARERGVLLIKGGFHMELEGEPYPHGFWIRLSNSGLSLLKVVSMEWAYVDEPVWSNHLTEQSNSQILILPGEQADSTWMEWRDPRAVDLNCWLIGKVHYVTLEDERFFTTFALHIDYSERNYLGHDRWTARSELVSGQPMDT
ncbi:MAG: hypothetical protein Q27BB25_04535 [Blastomonas sp. CACIA14H2]|uniref:hypothetical protein n=1 Tax=Blastomonas sp. CACIA14H2 TaxID=1419876 RepID=UPI0003CFEE23|nr:MAG: hypothetical protein Q27BB25_04535 [Blastomonas sp. CACIA14H2]